MRKKITTFITACALLLAGTSCTDTQSDHLVFSGVPIDGTIEEVCSKLEKKGFELRTTDNTMGMLRGSFAGCSDCYIGVTGQNGQAATVTVIYPRTNSWGELSGRYYALKEWLEKKYGEPAECIETFVNPVDGDEARIYEASNGGCQYKATFLTKGGEITLNVNGDFENAYVELDFRDNANNAKIQERNQDL